MSTASLEAAIKSLKKSNDALAKSVSNIPTIPPQAPTCLQCGKVRRPFAALGLCGGCNPASTANRVTKAR